MPTENITKETKGKELIEEFSLNYQHHKVGISADYLFPFISFVKFIVFNNKFFGQFTI